jgi:nucleoside-diphosphate-sugar epimerase
MKLVCSNRWDVFCHHGAEVDRYREPDYDIWSAVAANTLNIGPVFAALAERGLHGIVLTGTVFEPREGIGEEPLRAFSPYGVSKACTADIVEYWADQHRIGYGKFVIANPFGPYEEPRFCNYLFRCWRVGEVAEVRTPAYLRDNVPVRLLAGAYVRFVDQVAASGGTRLYEAPSYYVESQGEFAKRVARETRSRIKWECRLLLADQTEFPEPRIRVNKNPIASASVEESSCWDEYIFFATASQGEDVDLRD